MLNFLIHSLTRKHTTHLSKSSAKRMEKQVLVIVRVAGTEHAALTAEIHFLPLYIIAILSKMKKKNWRISVSVNSQNRYFRPITDVILWHLKTKNIFFVLCLFAFVIHSVKYLTSYVCLSTFWPPWTWAPSAYLSQTLISTAFRVCFSLPHLSPVDPQTLTLCFLDAPNLKPPNLKSPGFHPKILWRIRWWRTWWVTVSWLIAQQNSNRFWDSFINPTGGNSAVTAVKDKENI